MNDGDLWINRHKREQSAVLADDVAVWLAKGNTIETVDHTRNAGYLKDQRKRKNGLTMSQARAEITKQNGAFFQWHKKGARK